MQADDDCDWLTDWTGKSLLLKGVIVCWMIENVWIYKISFMNGDFNAEDLLKTNCRYNNNEHFVAAFSFLFTQWSNVPSG